MSKMPIELQCPECFAQPGERCKDETGAVIDGVHPRRWENGAA
jgi:hypothetical protein